MRYTVVVVVDNLIMCIILLSSNKMLCHVASSLV